MILLTTALALAQAPEGYVQMTVGDGVEVWRQDWDPGEPDYVVIIDLDGARFESIVEPAENPEDPLDPTLWRNDLRRFEAMAPEEPFAMFNGVFFSPTEDPARIAFGIRTEDFYSVGYGTYVEFTDQQRILQLDGGRANIWDQTPGELNATPAEQYVSLATDAPKSPDAWIPRTFLGLKDVGPNGYRTIVVFISEVATQAYAADQLLRWGAGPAMMLDGGGSTNFRLQGENIVYSGRTIPLAFAVYEGLDPDTAVDSDTDTDSGTDVDVGTDIDSDSDPGADRTPTPTRSRTPPVTSGMTRTRIAPVRSGLAVPRCRSAGQAGCGLVQLSSCSGDGDREFLSVGLVENG